MLIPGMGLDLTPCASMAQRKHLGIRNTLGNAHFVEQLLKRVKEWLWKNSAIVDLETCRVEETGWFHSV